MSFTEKLNYTYIKNGFRIHYDVWCKKRCVTKKQLEKLKGTKIGQRCFVVGNGPSLTIEDLEKIKGEDSFAVNRIFKLFNKTDWRPTYYFSQDDRVVNEIAEDLPIILRECKGVFINSCGYNLVSKDVKKCENMNFIYIDNLHDSFPELPSFSFDITNHFVEGYTVAYACIQMAVYMGYSEIYIIGTDHSYNINRTSEGIIEKEGSVQNYMPELAGKVLYAPQMEKSTLAYRKARQVCDQKGIKIMNATRGGMLEEFERVDFDSLF